MFIGLSGPSEYLFRNDLMVDVKIIKHLIYYIFSGVITMTPSNPDIKCT